MYFAASGESPKLSVPASAAAVCPVPCSPLKSSPNGSDGTFAPEFAAALSGLDRLILLDIYPAREEPIPGVSSEIIFRDVTIADKVLVRKEELMDTLAAEKLDVLVTFGAGNIDRFVEPITKMLESR